MLFSDEPQPDPVHSTTRLAALAKQGDSPALLQQLAKEPTRAPAIGYFEFRWR